MNMESDLALESCILHVFKNIWTLTIGERLSCRREVDKVKDRYAVAVLRDCTTIGHVPRKISAACALAVSIEEKAGGWLYSLCLILEDFNLVVGWSIHQTAKFNSHQIFRLHGMLCVDCICGYEYT